MLNVSKLSPMVPIVTSQNSYLLPLLQLVDVWYQIHPWFSCSNAESCSLLKSQTSPWSCVFSIQSSDVICMLTQHIVIIADLLIVDNLQFEDSERHNISGKVCNVQYLSQDDFRLMHSPNEFLHSWWSACGGGVYRLSFSARAERASRRKGCSTRRAFLPSKSLPGVFNWKFCRTWRRKTGRCLWPFWWGMINWLTILSGGMWVSITLSETTVFAALQQINASYCTQMTEISDMLNVYTKNLLHMMYFKNDHW